MYRKERSCASSRGKSWLMKERSCTVLEGEARLMLRTRGSVYSSREKQDNVQTEMSCTYSVLESEVGCCTEREILYSSRGRSRLIYKERSSCLKADVKIDNSCTILEGKQVDELKERSCTVREKQGWSRKRGPGQF